RASISISNWSGIDSFLVKWNAGPPQSTRIRFEPGSQLSAETVAGGGQPGGDGALRDAQRGGDLAVRVAVVVAQDDGRLLLGRQPAQGLQEVARERPGRLRVGLWRAAQPAHELACLAQLGPAPVGERLVDRDPVEPGFGRGGGAPPRPVAEGFEVRLMEAILGRGPRSEERRVGKEGRSPVTRGE